ncbi:hypothetical protein HRR83_009579 [Exophiala dermatitidis]|uniref:Uncharacterized protein n=2 Tax=Exophiala dermatitidis TaxID=5970 RepID=H6CBT9_EXODN|nr:uncharacterized protein HMPREF1120_09172 [Exophiala dermatitidis NIH/UT8656]KAJ4501902.1 hypothetical protein HRR75_008835 [Exophiala dermatitidis]EHY61236.1 hypothetical protein HMPREF1120_09172 [Exophiala dermatitidis NIH/UT8656]KAJ4502173.1 hypothetical protein HRR73_009564 [Exophiala dermatitidis]KAJ4502308.1 hypothetical protein HRR74_009599 [Exophiala dermatitidis]KAJ4528880.1 hypothetical protein HRR76_009497 [Exophiala dermatitidis]
MKYKITGYPTSYPYAEYLDLPTDEELGVDLANFCHDEARNLKDGRMMLAAGLVGTDMIKLAKSVFRIPGVNPKIREFIVLRVAKHVGGVNPWGPNLRMLENLDATEAEVQGILSDGPVTGMDEESSLIMRACDELTLQGCIQDPTMKRMKERYDRDTICKYVLTLSWYNMFNRYVVSTRVPLENQAEIDEKIGRSTRPA